MPLELGLDIGGSLRAPAHYCGVSSHKPSLDLIPQRGSGRRKRRRCRCVATSLSPTPAFPHDHTPIQIREFDIDGRKVPYGDQIAWAGPATLSGLPAAVAPIERTASVLPIGAQIIGGLLEDRTTIAFAGLIEREFGGFVRPPLG